MTDFAWTKDQFHLPEGMIYLDGNSLGPMPKATPARVQRAMEPEWRDQLIGGWVGAGWHLAPERLGDRIAAMIGAEAGHVVVGDTLSIKIYQALAAALAARGVAHWKSEVIPLDEDDLTAKIEAIDRYQSQLEVLFGSPEAMPDRVRDYVTLVGGERLWQPDQMHNQ